MKVGLFFGSFNPIHIGHMIVASLIKESDMVDEIWFIVSPQNPFKKNKNLLHEFDRLDLVQAAIHDEPEFKVSDIEFNMPRPSYTVDTLARLQDKFRQHSFKLIIGSDNLESFQKWKNYDKILQHFGLIVYPRPGYKGEYTFQNIEKIDAPKIAISATEIRRLIKEGKSIKYLVPEEVRLKILAKKYFRD